MKKYLPVFLLITLAIISRIIPHPANFTPVAAIAIFAGIYLPKRMALLAPIAGMLISDIFIGFYSLPIMATVYISFIISTLIGVQIGKNISSQNYIYSLARKSEPDRFSLTHFANKKFHTILGGTLSGSIIFFILTNFAVWAFGTMYAHNLSGLMESYYMALPFFKNSLAGDMFYVAVLIGGMEFIIHTSTRRAAQLS